MRIHYNIASTVTEREVYVCCVVANLDGFCRHHGQCKASGGVECAATRVQPTLSADLAVGCVQTRLL